MLASARLLEAVYALEAVTVQIHPLLSASLYEGSPVSGGVQVQTGGWRKAAKRASLIQDTRLPETHSHLRLVKKLQVTATSQKLMEFI